MLPWQETGSFNAVSTSYPKGKLHVNAGWFTMNTYSAPQRMRLSFRSGLGSVSAHCFDFNNNLIQIIWKDGHSLHRGVGLAKTSMQ